MKILALIPHFNHPKTIAYVAHTLRDLGLDVLIVDDGSSEENQLLIQNLISDSIQAIFHAENQGKGAAVKTGFFYAEQHGYSHVLQVDADAQHQLSDAIQLLEQSQSCPNAVICGAPQYGDDAPKSRLYGRKITDFWNMIHTASLDIVDGMCGFRLYPLECALRVIREEYVGNRMDFDVEILVRLYWRGVQLIWVQTPVKYEKNGVSHFKMWRDNVMISKMHTRLFFGMLKRRLNGTFKKNSA